VESGLRELAASQESLAKMREQQDCVQRFVGRDELRAGGGRPAEGVRLFAVPAVADDDRAVVGDVARDRVLGRDAARSLVKLFWDPAGSAEQAVAVSARPDGLDGGNYTTSETLPASQSTYELRESQPGGIYYWRVLTRGGDGWLASATATFEGPTCVTF